MFDAWKARRQHATARLDGWQLAARHWWAGARRREAGWKLAWNRQERHLRRAWQRRVHS